MNYMSIVIQGVLAWIAAHKDMSDRLLQIKPVLVKLHDIIEVVYPDIAQRSGDQHLLAARRELDSGSIGVDGSDSTSEVGATAPDSDVTAVSGKDSTGTGAQDTPANAGAAPQNAGDVQRVPDVPGAE